jgi:Holliday junction resolvasome RuvABC DNA-binding subunit
MGRIKEWFNRKFSKSPKYDLQMDEVDFGPPANKGRPAKSVNATDGRTRSVTKTESPSAIIHLTPADSPSKESRSLSRFKIGRIFAKNKATNTTIQTASKDNQRKAKKYLQELGYKGNDLKKIMARFKDTPDEHYLDALKDIPKKKFAILGYATQRDVNLDFDEALATLMNTGFSTKDAKFAILHAQDNADKNNFRKSFKEIINSRITGTIGSSDHLHEAKADKELMLSWAMDQLLEKNIAFDNQLETQRMLEDIYLTVSKEYSEKPRIHINSIFMEKIYEMIQKPPPRDEEETEVKRQY